ncbi:MAG TPA: TlpA disulfide reductase family protein [Acetobacteraceae bacterium]|nr:TlpA disulfide reductase family protein [Acetobacteraceae bacterium]
MLVGRRIGKVGRIVHWKESGMLITRRRMLATAAAGGTLAAGLTPRKLRAAQLNSVSSALKLIVPAMAPPAITFLDAAGKPHHLSEFLGHGMLINLWATWCPPCVEEMPSLAVMAKALAPNNMAVLPLSADNGGAKAVEAFFARRKITGLPVLLDPDGAAARAFNVPGLPTSIVIGKKGLQLARAVGAVNWAAPEAASIVQRLAEG